MRKDVFGEYVDHEGSDRAAHPRSLIRTLALAYIIIEL